MKIASIFESQLIEWMTRMVLVAVSFSAGFRLRFERSERRVDRPQVLYLDIKAAAYVGDIDEWRKFVESLPLRARRGEEDEPALAYRLMLLVGAETDHVELTDEGTLILGTSDSETITVMGTDDVWDESWSISEPEDVVGRSARFVTCDSKGELTGRWGRRLG